MAITLKIVYILVKYLYHTLPICTVYVSLCKHVMYVLKYYVQTKIELQMGEKRINIIGGSFPSVERLVLSYFGTH